MRATERHALGVDALTRPSATLSRRQRAPASTVPWLGNSPRQGGESRRPKLFVQSPCENPTTMKRSSVVEMLAERIAAGRRSHPVRVAIDGVDGVGKTTLANELVQPILERGR